MKTIFKHLTLAAAVSSVAMISAQANAYEAGDWIVRAGLVNVSPDDSSDGVAIPVLGVAPIPGTGVEVDDDTQLGLTVTYMMNSTVGIELLAATPFTHDITADLSAAGFGKVNAGETSQLPPTLSVVWYPMGSSEKVSPYVGAGINYTVFFEEDVSPDLKAAVPAVSNALGGPNLGTSVPLEMKLHDSVGLALQAGVDVVLNERWLVNASVRWIDIDTEAKISSALGNTITIDDIQIDPWVYQLNVGYKF